MKLSRLIPFGILLLVATVAIVALQVWRPKADVAQPVPIDSLAVVCRGRVDSAGQMRSLDPSQPGRVVAVHVTEGMPVKANDKIVSLDDRAYADAVKDAMMSESAAAIELQIAQAKADAAPAEFDALQKKIDGALAKVVAADAKLAQMKRQRSLTDSIPVTQEDVDSYQAQVLAVKLEIEAEQIRLAQMQKLDRTLEVKAAKLKLEAAQEAVVRAKRYQAECVIRAPADGTILRLQTAKGALIAPGASLQPPIIFVPDGPYIVRAELDQADVGRVSVGQAVTLQDDASREPRIWTGRVKEIAGWIAPRRSMLIEPGEFNDVRTTEVVIVLDPSQHKLLIGQRMVVRIGK